MTDLNLTIPGPQGATAGPYLRSGRTVFALHEGQVRKNAYSPLQTEMVNRWSALVQPHPGCSEGEAEAVAVLLAAAPALRDALRNAVALLQELITDGDPIFAFKVIDAARSALALAQGAAPDGGEGLK